jgi:hypothetical protein
VISNRAIGFRANLIDNNRDPDPAAGIELHYSGNRSGHLKGKNHVCAIPDSAYLRNPGYGIIDRSDLTCPDLRSSMLLETTCD